MLALLLIERLLEELSALLENHPVELRKIGGVVPYRVLHQENALYAHLKYVIISIFQVLKQLDDSHDQVGIAVPAEHIVDSRSVLTCNPLVHFLREMRKKHKRKTATFLLQIRSQIEHLLVTDVVHTYDHIDTHSRLQHLTCLRRRLHPDEFRRGAEVQVDIFLIDLCLNLTVLFKDKGIVVAAYHQDSPYAKAHK